MSGASTDESENEQKQNRAAHQKLRFGCLFRLPSIKTNRREEVLTKKITFAKNYESRGAKVYIYFDSAG
jgi:hypothetical protein